MPTALRPSLLFALACTADKGAGPDTRGPDSPADSPAPHSAVDSEPPVDGDGDGSPSTQDCDDANPAVYPGAPEQCDGVDQDCDGAADNGVLTDGAGCQEPTAPTWDDAVQIVHITARTGTGTTNGTDDPVSVCLSADTCFALNNADWDDNDTSQIDVFVYEGQSLSKADLDRFTVRVSDGGDQWRPSCLAVSLDGEPVYCRDGLTLKMGSEDDETMSWTDPEGLTLGCQGCYDSPLTHGPIVGATDASQSHIWLRTDASRRVDLRLASTEAGLGAASPVAAAWTEAANDFAQVLPVRGLSAGTWWYDVEVEGVRHGPWSFTTPGEGGLRLAFGSCTKDDEQPIFETIAAYQPELFLFVGDNHYGNTADLGSLRQYYRYAHIIGPRAALMASTPILATWDDHDYTGNNTDGTASGKEVALRAFTEYWANGSYGTPDTEGVFSAHRVGEVLIVLLDDRYWRGLEDSILGEAQTAWLLDTLQASDATFHLLVSGSQFTTQGSGDSWAAFPEAQEALLQALVDHQIGGVVLLSGDIHRSELRVLPGAPGGYALPELTSSPLANSSSLCTSESELRTCYDDGNSFILVDLDTLAADPTVAVSLIDEDGAILDRWEFSRSALDF